MQEGNDIEKKQCKREGIERINNARGKGNREYTMQKGKEIENKQCKR